MKKTKPAAAEFVVICDTRESRPYSFQGIKPNPPQTCRQALQTGDYSIAGLTDQVTIERKSLADLFGSVGTNRKRFESEMKRMATFRYAAIVIEADFHTMFLAPPERSKMNPKSVFRSLIAWSIRYNVHIWPAWDRASGEKITYILLHRFYDEIILQGNPAEQPEIPI